ncbi:hypothetical protein [Lentilactobacillus parabuchneri]
MKQRRNIITMIVAAVFSFGLMSGLSPVQNADAKQSVKVVRVKKVASKRIGQLKVTCIIHQN